jgi:Ala-tRNA(Pro) deacylase
MSIASGSKRIHGEEDTMMGTSSIHDFLRDEHVPYVVLPHAPAFTAQQEAAAAHVPGRVWGKVVICMVDDYPVEVVLPATLSVNLERLLTLARGQTVRLADEAELQRLFPECEPGAAPPFGPLYGLEVFVDVALAAADEIVCNAGTHTEAIAMRWPDFAAAVRPIVGSFAESHADKVAAYRLSYRE